MQRLLSLAGALASSAAAAQVTDVPLYCRLLEKGLEAASFQPILEDFNLSTVADAPVLGAVDVSASHLEIGGVRLAGCGASVDDAGHFRVAVPQLDVELKELAWRYAQRAWPHTEDFGVASGNTSVSFNVSINMDEERHEVFGLKLGKVEVLLGAKRHSWLSAALSKLTSFLRPVLSMAVAHAARESLDRSLAIVHKQGGCAFLQGSLAELGLAKLQFTSDEPLKAHVPLVGDVEISVNSTDIEPPTTMRCEHVGFNGSLLTARVEDVPMGAGFRWAYQKPNSSFWHNQGTGSAKVVAGTLLHIDVLQPSETRIEVELPTLKLELQADADAWMYRALTDVMGPLVRESLQLFGGKLLTHHVERCLEDPTCPHLAAEPPSAPAVSAERETSGDSLLIV